MDPVSVLYPSLIQRETLFTVLLVGGVFAWALYEFIEPIGHGGMGEVYRARDTRLGRDVAISF